MRLLFKLRVMIHKSWEPSFWRISSFPFKLVFPEYCDSLAATSSSRTKWEDYWLQDSLPKGLPQEWCHWDLGNWDTAVSADWRSAALQIEGSWGVASVSHVSYAGLVTALSCWPALSKNGSNECVMIYSTSDLMKNLWKILFYVLNGEPVFEFYFLTCVFLYPPCSLKYMYCFFCILKRKSKLYKQRICSV